MLKSRSALPARDVNGSFHDVSSHRFLVLVTFFCANAAASASELPQPPKDIVIGFVGGMVGHTNAIHSEVQLAARLGKDYPTGVEVRMFENRCGREARREVLALLDSDHDGRLSQTEKNRGRIVIYGRILGNLQFDYKTHPVDCTGYPRYARLIDETTYRN